MNLFILRHGETEWNVEKRFQGQLDSPLTERGIEQVKKTGEILSNIKFDGIYTSTLGRAINSTKIVLTINKYFNGEKIEKLKELNEIYFGEWQGMSHNEILEKYPENAYKYFNDVKNYNCKENKGENLKDGLKRFITGLNKIVKENRGRNVLIVTHGTIIELFLNYVNGKIYGEVDEINIIKNGDFLIFKYNNGKYLQLEKEEFLK